MTDAPSALTLLHADAWLVAVDKPAGLTVTPSPRPGDPACVRDALATQLSVPLWVVHRIDRDTSGVVVLARTAEAHRALSMAFEARRVQKQYVAFTSGCPAPRTGCIDTPLHEGRKGRMRPARSGEAGAIDARTVYAVVQTWQHDGRVIARVDAQPETGRHHQIRVHLRSVGTPLLGDAIYGSQAPWPAEVCAAHPSIAPRLALHAAALTVPHPETGAPLMIHAPLPEDLRALVAALDAAWQPGAAA